jgi:molybdopterin-binding protein
VVDVAADQEAPRRQLERISLRRGTRHREQLGTVKSIKLGEVMAEVSVDVGGQEVVAAITRESVERLGIKEGDSVTAIIKATEVMLAR